MTSTGRLASGLKFQVGTRAISAVSGRPRDGRAPMAAVSSMGQASGRITAAAPRRYRPSPSQSMPCQTMVRTAKVVMMPFMG